MLKTILEFLSKLIGIFIANKQKVLLPSVEVVKTVAQEMQHLSTVETPIQPNLEEIIINEIKSKFFGRQKEALTGSQFFQKYKNYQLSPARETLIFNEIVNGNLPSFFRHFKKITIIKDNNKLEYFVSSDYLLIGSDEDNFRIAIGAITAQKLCNLYNCILPTSKMVVDIHHQTNLKLIPMPQGAPYDHTMTSLDRIYKHHLTIEDQLKGQDKTQLISGHKKDTIIHPVMTKFPNNIVIFGWINKFDIPIQQVNAVSHDHNYCDYSQGIRLIYDKCILNDQITSLEQILKDNTLYSLVSDQVFTNIKYKI